MERLVYRIYVPAMGTTLEFSDKGSYNQYLEMFCEQGWEFETNIQPIHNTHARDKTRNDREAGPKIQPVDP
jgi:hypothetical protein